MEFKLHWVGVCVADFAASFRFYTEVLGIRSGPSNPEWAYLGHRTTASGQSMVLELFDQGVAPTGYRTWGNGQGIRPSFQVDDLDATVAALRARGVTFTGAVEERPWGREIAFVAPERIHWSLAHAPGLPAAPDLANPHLGWVAIKAHDLPAQIAFYRDVMGLTLAESDETHAVFTQGPGQPRLLLESGGMRTGLPQRYNPPWPERAHPVIISFRAAAMRPAYDWLAERGVRLLRRTTLHYDWGGSDLIILDADGNALQVVEYGRTSEGNSS